MNRILKTALFAGLLGPLSFSAFAHHPAEDIVDTLIWQMIDENVSDTPHADLDLTTMGSSR
jgi:hypothetical protein